MTPPQRGHGAPGRGWLSSDGSCGSRWPWSVSLMVMDCKTCWTVKLDPKSRHTQDPRWCDTAGVISPCTRATKPTKCGYLQASSSESFRYEDAGSQDLTLSALKAQARQDQ
jgi:hypothetical protein